MSHYIPEEPELKHVGGHWMGGNPQTFYPELWAYLVKTLGIKTVLDVGCGEGHALREFARLGCLAIGIDGAPRNVALAGKCAMVHDLTKGPFISGLDVGIDLVWSCEMVAQVEEKYVDNVIKTLAQGKYLALTVELPGQIGYHHVNCQTVSYWCRKLEAVGMVPDEANTVKYRAMGQYFWRTTGMLYRRKEIRSN